MKKLHMIAAALFAFTSLGANGFSLWEISGAKMDLDGKDIRVASVNTTGKVAFRRKIYSSIEELQADLDEWLAYYNNDRTHQGKMCCGRTPMQTLVDGKEVWRDKITTLNS